MSIDYDDIKHKVYTDELNPDGKYVKEIVEQMVRKYSKELDEFVDMVRQMLQLVKEATMMEYDDESLSMQTIKLPTLLYFAGNGLEDIGSDSEVATYKRKELYNEIITNLDTSKYTIPDKKAEAEAATETEAMIEKIYDRAYKKLKLKIEHGVKLLESLKKIIDLRIAKINKGKGRDER